ncbi:hypothetical protein SH668x_000695 [Planctomicrobium sp. SH668]|uniref:hypothetical protein n=1 Tax=Planctomicrobium sp. SH668 TaxID=3448126 RepID=UPI003F5AE25B
MDQSDNSRSSQSLSRIKGCGKLCLAIGALTILGTSLNIVGHGEKWIPEGLRFIALVMGAAASVFLIGIGFSLWIVAEHSG